MRVRNTVNHEFESQLECVEYVVTETYCGRRRWLLGNCAARRHSSYIASSKTTYLKMVAIVKRWIAWLWSGAVEALQDWMRKLNFFLKTCNKC